MSDERLGPSVVVGDVTLTPVERTELRVHPLGDGVAARGSKRVVAVIVSRGERRWRLELPAEAGESTGTD